MRNVIVGIGALFIFLSFVQPAHADKSYGYPSLSSMPARPDIMQYEGGTFVQNAWELTVAPRTFSYDIWYQHGCWKKTFPMRIGRYWQISDICEFWPRPHFKPNSAPAVSERSWIITYHYKDDDIKVLGGISFPEESLKIVFSDDHGESWTMLKSSIVDAENNTVAAITDGQGGYTVMAGFVSPNTYYNYKEVKGVSTIRGQEAHGGFSAFLEYAALLIGRVL